MLRLLFPREKASIAYSIGKYVCSETSLEGETGSFWRQSNITDSRFLCSVSAYNSERHHAIFLRGRIFRNMDIKDILCEYANLIEPDYEGVPLRNFSQNRMNV
jgi:hypothetical protein